MRPRSLLGATGSGKTTLILSILKSLLSNPRPKCALFLIDPVGNLSQNLLTWIADPKTCPNHVRDERYLATMTRHPRADRLSHWIELNNSRIVIEHAIARQTEIKLEKWISEYETINKDATEPERFTLQTTLCEVPPLSCSPDAGLLLSMSGQSKVYYVERDRGTSSPHQIAARKTRGYAELARQQGHLRHFSSATAPTFSVLFIPC